MPVWQIFLTILGSGVVSAWVTYTLNARKTEREYMRGKLETLWIAVHQFDLSIRIWVNAWLNYMEIHKNRDVLSEAQKDVINAETYQNIEMLINIYFLDLKPQFQAMCEARDKLFTRVQPAVAAEILPPNVEEIARHTRLNKTHFNKAIDQLKAGIYREADSLKKMPWQRQGDSISAALKQNRLFPEYPPDA